MSYNIGDIVWAQLRGYPFWPSIISCEPGTTLYRRDTGKQLQHHVTFLAENGAHSWVLVKSLKTFEPDDTEDKNVHKFIQRKYLPEWGRGHKLAMHAALEILLERAGAVRVGSSLLNPVDGSRFHSRLTEPDAAHGDLLGVGDLLAAAASDNRRKVAADFFTQSQDSPGISDLNTPVSSPLSASHRLTSPDSSLRLHLSPDLFSPAAPVTPPSPDPPPFSPLTQPHISPPHLVLSPSPSPQPVVLPPPQPNAVPPVQSNPQRPDTQEPIHETGDTCR